MGSYKIIGGTRLEGELAINGGKNAALPIMAASILNSGESILHHCPNISDTFLTAQILEELGCTVKREGKTVTINSADADCFFVRDGLVKKMRSSIIFLGVLLGRFKRVKIGFPGGCEIGARPIDLHLKAIQKMNVQIEEKDGFLICTTDGLSGAKINLDFPSVGATENIMLAAVLAEGMTIIYNAAREPEIVDLQSYLRKIGAKVWGAGTDTIFISGVKHLKNAEHTIIPDRIEAGTYLTAAAISGGEIFADNVKPDHIRQILLRLTETGCSIREMEDSIYLKAPKRLKPVELIRTLPYPGFPTDMQPQFISLLTIAKGTSIIIETVFEARYKHIVELCKMGADIAFEGRTAVIKGVKQLRGTKVNSYDLRGGAAMVIAGLAAEGETIVCNSSYMERGYEEFEKKLKGLGAKISFLE